MSQELKTPLSDNKALSGTVSAIAVIDLARELLQRDVLTQAQLEQVLDASSLAYCRQLQHGEDISEVLTQRLPEQQLIQLWQLADKTEDKNLGWNIGSQVVIPAQGILAHWIRHCQTLEQAFLTFVKHVHLLNASEGWQVEHGSSYVELSFHYPAEKAYPQIAVQRSLASIKSWGEYLSGDDLQISALFLTENFNDADSNLIEHIFQCPVYYDQPINKIQLAVSEIQKPLVQANALIAELLSQQALSCDTSIEKTLAQQIWDLFERDIQSYSQINLTAEKLNMSRATLYRRLKAQQTSFSDLLEKYRYQLWEGLVAAKGEEGSDNVRMSELLGFNDPSSFYKARKRWLKTQTG